MNKTLTLTLNPALDKTTSVEKLEPEAKLRCDLPKYEPGGGGINVSRVLKRLGGDSTAVFAAGGEPGKMLEKLLHEADVRTQCFATKGGTRENLTVSVKATQRQYRFVMPGAELEAPEYQAFLDYFEQNTPDWLIASGSLPKGVPDDFYAQLSKIVQAKNGKFVLDTSGEALTKAVETGVFLIKPNLKELSVLAGKEHLSGMEPEELAMELIESGKCEIVVVSLGPRGAFMATQKGIEHVIPPTVIVKSTVGAGDSMVAGMVWALTQDWDYKKVLQYGVACGTATTMNEGTELCHKEDVDRIFEMIGKKGG